MIGNLGNCKFLDTVTRYSIINQGLVSDFKRARGNGRREHEREIPSTVGYLRRRGELNRTKTGNIDPSIQRAVQPCVQRTDTERKRERVAWETHSHQRAEARTHMQKTLMSGWTVRRTQAATPPPLGSKKLDLSEAPLDGLLELFALERATRGQLRSGIGEAWQPSEHAGEA